jgi:uncharacterized protein
MLKRELAAKIDSLSGSFPVIIMAAPRQSGTTTLAKMQFPVHNYISLGDLDKER